MGGGLVPRVGNTMSSAARKSATCAWRSAITSASPPLAAAESIIWLSRFCMSDVRLDTSQCSREACFHLMVREYKGSKGSNLDWIAESCACAMCL